MAECETLDEPAGSPALMRGPGLALTGLPRPEELVARPYRGPGPQVGAGEQRFSGGGRRPHPGRVILARRAVVDGRERRLTSVVVKG